MLLSRGRIEQMGSAAEIYDQPATAYAAEFVGGANIIQGRIGDGGRPARLASDRQGGSASAPACRSRWQSGAAACVAIRPQKIRLLACGHSRRRRRRHGDAVPAAGPCSTRGEFEILGTTPLGDMRVLADHAPAAEGMRIMLPAEDCLCVRP